MFSSPLVVCFALFLSLPVVYLFSSSILPSKAAAPVPSSPLILPSAAASDELDDLSLFRRAATPAGRPPKCNRLGLKKPRPKIAFLFLTNSDLTFAPLWERFFKGHDHLYNIYIHADPAMKSSNTNSSSRTSTASSGKRVRLTGSRKHSNHLLLSWPARSIWDSGYRSPGGVFDGRFIVSKRTERATPALIAAARRLLASALLDDPANFYFALVSQHCIPLHSFSFMYKTLFGNSLEAVQAYINPSKFPSFIEILSDEPNLYERYTARGEDVMLPEVPFEQFRVGSQFFMLTRRHSLLAIKDRKLWRKFRLPCLNKESCYPEEHYFPTLLSMADPKGCGHYTLTRVNWTGSFDGHPHLYGPDEISPDLVYQLRESDLGYSHFFARKFSPESLRPLMDMADDIIFGTEISSSGDSELGQDKCFCLAMQSKERLPA
ncbi:glycosyltransferase BC10-like isoform X1 [Punica granatum]|uniref:Glycosyltransferase BC10-like isoform X1 n=1 Tax=Punica granatum TaxID=22663 RepID=A0A6P8BTQ0_PUNGR|nr:glycosyltransferase BC10-like isoform X1 [Punica granatum]